MCVCVRVALSGCEINFIIIINAQTCEHVRQDVNALKNTQQQLDRILGIFL
jgi:hypothetical protein